MAIIIGEVATFPNVQASKQQSLKPLEESAEVFEAWKKLCGSMNGVAGNCNVCSLKCDAYRHLLDECADVITATCNLLAALGVDDMREAMADCMDRNRKRGRL